MILCRLKFLPLLRIHYCFTDWTQLNSHAHDHTRPLVLRLTVALLSRSRTPQLPLEDTFTDRAVVVGLYDVLY